MSLNDIIKRTIKNGLNRQILGHWMTRLQNKNERTPAN